MYPLILFTQLYYPDNATTAIIMSDLTKDLVSYGLNVKVICAQPIYLSKKKCPKKEVRNKIIIRRVWTFLFDKNKNIERLLNSISCFFAMLITLFSIEKNAILIFNTNPALLPLLGFISNKLGKQKYVILIHDLWPELPAHIKMVKKGGMLYRIIDFLVTLSFRDATSIIVLSDTMKKRILTKVPRKEHCIHVIHNWADANRVFPIEKENIRLFDGLGLKNKKIIMYSGNLGRYQPLEVMIGAAYELKDRNDILFLFVGNGWKKTKIQNMVEGLKLNNVKFLPFQPLDRLSESLSMADVSLMGIYPENEGVIMPSKLYSLLAIGKPIICVADPESEVAKILEQAKAGIQSSVTDPKELASKILKIIDDQEKVIDMGKNGRKYFLEHFERKIITRQWHSILNKLISNK